VQHAKETMHGQVRFVYHTATAQRSHLLSKIPSPFEVVRYHSLAVTDLPDCIEAFAATDDDTIMGIRHKSLPFWGVQFHPESICTAYGAQLLKNFAELAKSWNSLQNELPLGRIAHSLTPPSSPSSLSTLSLSPSPPLSPEANGEILAEGNAHWLMNGSPRSQPGLVPHVIGPSYFARSRETAHPYSLLNSQKELWRYRPPQSKPQSTTVPSYKVRVRRLPYLVDSALVFSSLFKGNDTSFWLDSARVRTRTESFQRQ